MLYIFFLLLLTHFAYTNAFIESERKQMEDKNNWVCPKL